MDPESLKRFCTVADDDTKCVFHKRIGDVCLSMPGLFPEHINGRYRYPISKQARPQTPGRKRLSPESYREEGKRFYTMAAGHRLAEEQEPSTVLETLSEDFESVSKPLSFMFEHYLHYRRDDWFV